MQGLVVAFSFFVLGFKLGLSDSSENFENSGLLQNLPEVYLGQYQPEQEDKSGSVEISVLIEDPYDDDDDKMPRPTKPDGFRRNKKMIYRRPTAGYWGHHFMVGEKNKNKKNTKRKNEKIAPLLCAGCPKSLMRVTRSSRNENVPKEYSRSIGILRSTRSAPPESWTNADILRSMNYQGSNIVRNTGILRSTSSTQTENLSQPRFNQPDDLRSTAIMRSTRSGTKLTDIHNIGVLGFTLGFQRLILCLQASKLTNGCLPIIL